MALDSWKLPCALALANDYVTAPWSFRIAKFSVVRSSPAVSVVACVFTPSLPRQCQAKVHGEGPFSLALFVYM